MLKTSLKKITIRPAKKSDSSDISELINELAVFEKLPIPDIKARKRLMNDAFSKTPPFKILLSEINGILSGYSIYFFTYSSFRANKTLYLEDIFISEKYRNMGIGKLFFKELTKTAKKNKCSRMEWVVLDWNINAIKFYDKLGATQLKEWKMYRVSL
ncbi:MAG: GNAT family N-acetyltransferase [Ignavibacteria bacterium]